ncbi:MAG: aldehyde dehydrogenase family protein [Burkholderiales bacterium]|nr:aldehyde dehydrogenase family protein [Burkholderiales bacterium]
MSSEAYPRVTYTNIGVDFSGLQAMLDRELPAYRRNLGMHVANVIDGKLDDDGRRYAIASPIDSALRVATSVETSAGAVRRAVAAANNAFAAWRALPWEERVAILERVPACIAARKYELGMACLFEVGKSRFEAVGEVEESMDIIPFYAAEVRRNAGYVRGLQSSVPGERTTTRLRPFGTFAVIGPFNYPVAVPVNMISAAVITGNTCVYKPSAGASLTASILLDCFRDAGIPPGVVNLVCGGDAVGEALVAAGVDGVVFTGSNAGGRAILAALSSGPSVRPVIAEMGGKNPTYVTRTADLDLAAEGLARSAFGLQGQKCSSCEVAYVDSAIHDEFVQALVAKTAALKVGSPEAAATFIGPLIDGAAGDRYRDVVQAARKAGQILHGGERLQRGDLARGVYVEPLIVGGLAADHAQVRDELFLPYVALQRYDSLDEALARGSSVRYGLTAGFYGSDPRDLDLFLQRAEAGVLYANRRSGATTGAWPGVQSFGGWKASGTTGKNAFGPHYLPLFMREQSWTLMGAP